MKILTQPKRVTNVSYQLSYHWPTVSKEVRKKTGLVASPSGSGFGFTCDKHGNVDFSGMSKQGIANFDKCVNGEFDIIFTGIERYENSFFVGAVGRCDCGTRVHLDGFTNTCEGCGADYNMSGQRLAPRWQWGEDTGESVNEILNI